jgi:hypothetical protein
MMNGKPINPDHQQEEVKAELDKEIERLKLDAIGEFGMVGGLYVH